MNLTSISRPWLRKRLVRAAQARSLITLAAVPFVIVLSALLWPLGPEDVMGTIFMFAVFLVPMLVCWIVTVKLCRTLVTCPLCQGSLWECGSGDFKPRKMRLRTDIDRCPHCGAKFE
jgi:hypothetical protein